MMALWTATDLPLGVKLHRTALERQVAEWCYIAAGTPIRFTDDEVPRLAFLWWLVHEAKRLDPRERLAAEDGWTT